jgi:hypothetical protein
MTIVRDRLNSLLGADYLLPRVLLFSKRFLNFCVAGAVSGKFIFIVAFSILGSPSFAYDDKWDDEIQKRFLVEWDRDCKKVKKIEPRRPNTPFFSQRYYLSIDGEEKCQIIDVWIQRITNLPTDNRREIYSIVYRFNGKKWLHEFGLDDRPLLRIKDKKTGIVYFFTELNEDLFYRKAIVYFSGSWQNKDGLKINSGLQPLDLCQNVPVFECKFIRAALERIIWLELRKEAF